MGKSERKDKDKKASVDKKDRKPKKDKKDKKNKKDSTSQSSSSSTDDQETQLARAVSASYGLNLGQEALINEGFVLWSFCSKNAKPCWGCVRGTHMSWFIGVLCGTINYSMTWMK